MNKFAILTLVLASLFAVIFFTTHRYESFNYVFDGNGVIRSEKTIEVYSDILNWVTRSTGVRPMRWERTSHSRDVPPKFLIDLYENENVKNVGLTFRDGAINWGTNEVWYITLAFKNDKIIKTVQYRTDKIGNINEVIRQEYK